MMSHRVIYYWRRLRAKTEAAKYIYFFFARKIKINFSFFFFFTSTSFSFLLLFLFLKNFRKKMTDKTATEKKLSQADANLRKPTQGHFSMVR